MDYRKLNDDELIELCKEKGIEYYNSRTKKNYAKSTLITRLNKTISEITEIDTKIEQKEEEIINIEYKNEVIWTLSNEDKKNNDEYKEIENKLKSCIRSCHNYLYSNGSIVGNEASNDIVLLFILKVINYLYISNKDIIINKIKSLSDNKDYNKYLDYLKDINNLKNISSDNDINSQYEDYMDDVIRGKLLPLIFTEDKDFILNSKSEENNIIKIINEFNNIIIDDITIKSFSTISIYEYFNSGYEGKSKNKKMGQFFTPKKIINSILYGCQFKNMIMDLSNPSIYDPCCGTAGLLCLLYNNCSNINKNNIYGCEISKDTIKYAISSLMLSTNSLFENLNKGCALSNNKFIFQNKKFDVIFTNPPFGTDNKYKELKIKFDKNKPENFNIKFEDIYPINCNNGVNLFLMNIIYSLNDNGICAVIVPDGELIYSKSLFNMRKYIIDNCKMLKIISIESKAFEYTQIKTNVLIFKKQKGEDNYKNVEFLEINKDCNQVKLIAVADLDKYYTFKLETETNDIIDYELNKDIEIKTLGEIASINIGGTPKRDNLLYYNNGTNPWVSIRELNNNIIYDTKEKITDLGVKNSNVKLLPINTILFAFKLSIGKIGIAGVPLYTNEAIAGINTNDDTIINKYLYYYLYYTDFKHLASGLIGTCGSLNKKILEELKIPIPSIEKQEEIVKYLDELDNKNRLFEYSNNKLFELLLNKSDINDRIELFNNIENTNIDINNNINKLNKLNNYKLKIVKYNPTTEIKSLGEIVKYKSGKRLPQGHKLHNDKTEYPYIRITDIDNNSISLDNIKYISTETKKIINKYIITIYDIYITIAGTTGLVGIIPYQLNGANLTENAISISIINNNEILQKYLLYNLKYNQQEELKKNTLGSAIPKLSIERLMTLKIPIPSLEVQNDIIEYCDNNLEIINNLKKTIENNKKMMKELF
jgi:type I restriction enzyme S subunit